MAVATSTEIRAALRKASAWGSPEACGAGDGLLILPHSINKTREALPEDSLGSAFATGLDYGSTKVEGQMPAYMRYDGLDLPMALVLGATGGAPSQQGATTAYSQSMVPASDVDGLFATLAVNNGVNVDEYPSVKLTGFTMSGQVGRPVEVSFNCTADERKVDSTTNTPASFAAVSVPEGENRLLMSQAVFRMNDASGAALDSSHTIRPSSFELTFERKLRGAYTAGSEADNIDEPMAEEQVEVTLKLEFPRYRDKTYFEQWDAGTLKKLDITFTGALIEDAYYRTLKLSFPGMAFTQAELPIEQGALRHPIGFACLESASAPSGMSGITAPVVVGIINTNDADVLA